MSGNVKKTNYVVGMALDPIHVGTGGARLGRVDLSIVRDPVTKVPKIPGSSLAGVYRTYAAMAQQEADPQRQLEGSPKPYFPDCAGVGQPDAQGKGGHCGKPDCPVCTVFGFTQRQSGSFAGLAAFSDAHVLLFPVATRGGPMWITCPEALRQIEVEIDEDLGDAIYREDETEQWLNLGWLLLPVEKSDGGIWQSMMARLAGSERWQIPKYILDKIALVSDKLFSHVVNSNLEVRTSVSIVPSTGTAEEGALFTYEALPRSTILVWQITCKNPKHFKVADEDISAIIGSQVIDSPERVFEFAQKAHSYLEQLGIGGMGTRGMGRLRVMEIPQEVAQQTES